MRKRLFAISILCGILLWLDGCGLSGAPTERETKQTATITIKAAIVYKMGGPHPVARTTFYLSREDLLSTTKKDIGLLGLQANYDSQVGQVGNDGRHALNLGREVEAAAIGAMTTDFEGNAKFAPVPSGVYYIIGVTETRSGVAIWNVRVDLTDSTTVILDQNNTAYMN